MTTFESLRLCVCGHLEQSHESSKCQELVPNNNGVTHHYTEVFVRCPCNHYDTAYDSSLENPRVQSFGASY